MLTGYGKVPYIAEWMSPDSTMRVEKIDGCWISKESRTGADRASAVRRWLRHKDRLGANQRPRLQQNATN